MLQGLLHFPFPPRLTEPLAITHVTVLPMDEERLLSDQTLVLEHGFIQALGPANEIQIEGMRCVDGTGKYVMPGLADMHVHYDDPGDFLLFLAMRPDLDALLAHRRAFVHDPHAFIPSTLSRSTGTEPMSKLGMWQEELHGGRVGDRRYYRQYLQQDGLSVLEEESVGGEYTYVRGIQRAIERRSTRLWLEPTGILRRAEILIESLAGSEQYRLERIEQTDYHLDWREGDGHETSDLLHTPILFPTVQLTMTALPLLLEGQMKQAGEMVLPTFGLERDGLHLYALKIVPFAEENGESVVQGEVCWQVTIDRPVAPVTLIYHLSADGTVVRVRSFGSTWIPGKQEK